MQLREKVSKVEELNELSKGKINKLTTDLTKANSVFERMNAGSKCLDDILDV